MTSQESESTAAFRCLVVDDSDFARWNIGRVVVRLGGSVVGEAKNGEEALVLFGTLQPDLVLLDITMPELDGIETLRRIRAASGDARVIMVSSVGHKELVWKALLLGARHFITKPFTLEYAGLVIQSVLAGESAGAV